MPARSPVDTVLSAALAFAALLALSACGGLPQTRPSAAGGYRPVNDTPAKLGQPYAVRGITYTPRADPGYDRLGFASWYGPESGSTTANGETFRPDGVSGAHTTLPLPTYAEVTSLDTGRTILVRINDRGPFATGKGLIVDLSRGAARQLGILQQGIAPVRLRVVEPSEGDRELLRQGRAAPERQRLGESELRRLRARLENAGRR